MVVVRYDKHTVRMMMDAVTRIAKVPRAKQSKAKNVIVSLILPDCHWSLLVL